MKIIEIIEKMYYNILYKKNINIIKTIRNRFIERNGLLKMKSKVVVQICDMEYSLLTEESEEYVKSLASEITKMIESAVYKNLRTSKTDAAMLICLELCDKIHKLSVDNSNMSRQIMEYVDEIGELSRQLSAAERKKQNKGAESVEDINAVNDIENAEEFGTTNNETEEELQEDLA